MERVPNILLQPLSLKPFSWIHTLRLSLVLCAAHTCDATAHIGLESVPQLTIYNENTVRKAANFERKLFERTFRHSHKFRRG